MDGLNPTGARLLGTRRPAGTGESADAQRRRGERVSWSRDRHRPDVLSNCSRILLIDLERSDLHINEGGLDICMTHQLHEGRQANAGAHHIRREGVPKTVGFAILTPLVWR